MQLKLISCEVFQAEVREVQARTRNTLDVEFLPKVPHELSDAETVLLFQRLIDQASPARHQAILLLAGSCRTGLTGLTARAIPIVLPRVKDCISLLLASTNSPQLSIPSPALTSGGTRRSPGEHRSSSDARLSSQRLLPTHDSAPHALGPQASWEWRAQFGGKAGGVQKANPGGTRRRLTVLEMLVNGYWNYTEFLVVPAGWRVVVSSPEGSLSAEEMPL